MAVWEAVATLKQQEVVVVEMPKQKQHSPTAALAELPKDQADLNFGPY